MDSLHGLTKPEIKEHAETLLRNPVLKAALEQFHNDAVTKFSKAKGRNIIEQLLEAHAEMNAAVSFRNRIERFITDAKVAKRFNTE